MLPTVGRVVHWEPRQPAGGLEGPLPAIVVKIRDEQGSADLAIFTPSPMPMANVPAADEPTPGHWNWPPRVGA